MKIVLVSLASRGGMLHFQVELANALSRIASTAVVMSSAAPVSYLEHAVQTFGRQHGPRRPRLNRKCVAIPCRGTAYGRDLARAGADLVHVTGAHAWNPLVAVFTKLRGKPLLYTVHDPQEHGGAPLSIRISNWITTRMADAIIVLTRYGEQQLIAKWSSGAEDPHNPARRVFLLPEVAALRIPEPARSSYTSDALSHTRAWKRWWRPSVAFGRIFPAGGCCWPGAADCQLRCSGPSRPALMS